MNNIIFFQKSFTFVLFLSIFSFFTAQQQVSLTFDGSGDYIQTNYPGILGNNSRTVEAWVKTTANSGENLVVTWGSESVSGARFTVRLNNISGSLKLRIENKGGGINGNITLNDGNWHHIAVVYDNNAPTTSRYQLYVDGNLDVQGNITTALNTIADTNMIIGRRINPALGGFFNGTMDEIRVWNVALSMAEIQANMNKEICTPNTNLVCNYRFNEGMAGADNTAIATISDNTMGASIGNLIGFTLTGTSSNFTSGQTTLTVCSLGVDEIGLNSSFILAPNPSDGLLNIKGDEKIKMVSITNLVGQKLIDYKLDATSGIINMTSLKPGIYLVEVISNNQSRIYKIIKK